MNTDRRVGVQFDKTGLEPRIGLSWKVLGSQTTVLRAGYAIYHDSSWNIGGQGLDNNLPFEASSGLGPFGFPGACPAPAFPTNPNPGVKQTCAIGGGYPVGSGVFTTPPPDHRFLWHCQLAESQLQAGHDSAVHRERRASTAGQYRADRRIRGIAQLTHSGKRPNMNVGSPKACFTDPNYHLGCGLPSAAPFQFNYVSNFTDTGAARYDSLQIKVETKSARHGLYLLLGYTYSRTFDSGFNDGLGTTADATYWPLPGNQSATGACPRSSSTTTSPPASSTICLSARANDSAATGAGRVNAVLGGWQVNVIEKITSGFPIFTITSTDNSGVNFWSTTAIT